MNIWIINHYALPPSLGGLNRHYYFSKYLQQMGHSVRIFTASAIHNTDINMIEDDFNYIEKIVDGIEYTYVQTNSYKKNGLSRIRNMLEFPLRVWKVCRKFPKPDVIYTSSPTPFAAVAALRIAQKLEIPCIVEIRDLWPESIVAYQKRSRNNPAILALYQLEKWIYKKADRLIFLKEGDKDYLKERGWDNQIDLGKVYYINNGVDIEEYDRNAHENILQDVELDRDDTFKVVYAGSLRAANNLLPVVKAAEILRNEGADNIHIFLYGAGGDLPLLRKYKEDHGLSNVHIKGQVNKKYIPFILSKSDISLVHVKHTAITRFGPSLNKLFEYMAAGKPILSDWPCGYDLVKRYECGAVIPSQTPDTIAEGIKWMAQLPKDTATQYGRNARQAAENFDFKKLTGKLLEILEGVVP